VRWRDCLRPESLLTGGVDGELGLVLLEGTLRGAAGGGWEGVAADVGGVRIYTQPAWTPPAPASDDAETAGGGGSGADMSVGGGGGGASFALMAKGGDPAADAEALAPKLYPAHAEPFWFVSDDDGRRRPADRNALELWAPATPHTIPLAPSGLELETERHDVPHVPGAFALTGGVV